MTFSIKMFVFTTTKLFYGCNNNNSIFLIMDKYFTFLYFGSGIGSHFSLSPTDFRIKFNFRKYETGQFDRKDFYNKQRHTADGAFKGIGYEVILLRSVHLKIIYLKI